MSDRESVASVSHDHPTSEELEHGLDEFLKPLVIEESTIHTLAYQFSSVYKDLALHSEEQFLPTPVTKQPSGQERGQYLAIDVGAPTYASLLSTSWTSGAKDVEKAWPIGEHLKKDKTEDLFAWIGDCIAEVVGDRMTSETGRVDMPPELDMGITFSFPMMQTELSAATLMPMGKGFTITSDLDLGPSLLEGYSRHTRREVMIESSPRLKRRKLELGPLPRLRIRAITNDTIATLVSLSYSVKSLPNSRVAAGIIVGTGCNATIPMNFNKLGEHKYAEIKARNPEASETVVNTEITIAGACGPLKAITTKWDSRLDAACARPGFQPLEYMTGGRYIGELVRLIFYDYVTTKYQPPLTQDLPVAIATSYGLTTTFVSSIIARARSTGELQHELGRRIPFPEGSHRVWNAHLTQALRKIAHLVQVRSAGLIAASTVGLLAAVGEIALSDPSTPSEVLKKQEADGFDSPSPGSKDVPPVPVRSNTIDSRDGLAPAPGVSSWHSGPEELVIAYTGGIIQHYPHFKEQCQRFIDRLVMKAGPQEGGKSVFLRESRDGGIIGAGVLAGMESARDI